MAKRRRCFLLLILFLLLLISLLPALLKSALGLVFSRAVADPEIPLVSGSVETLNYHGLIVSDLVADAGNGVFVRMPRLEVAYSPGTLLRGRVPSVEGKIVSESNIVFEAGFWFATFVFLAGFSQKHRFRWRVWRFRKTV